MDRITEAEIKQKLMRHYGRSKDRDLVKNHRDDGYSEDGGSVIYSLRGSPPKGYALVKPRQKEISLYDSNGKRFRQLVNTEVLEIVTEPLASIDEFEHSSVYAIPELGRTGSKAWHVTDVDSTGFTFLKHSGSSGDYLKWSDKPAQAERTVRQLVEDGEIFEIK